MIGSRATTASACRALLRPPGADVFRLRTRVPGRHRKIKLGDWRQPWLRVAGALLLVVSACIHLGLYLTGYRSIQKPCSIVATRKFAALSEPKIKGPAGT